MPELLKKGWLVVTRAAVAEQQVRECSASRSYVTGSMFQVFKFQVVPGL